MRFLQLKKKFSLLLLTTTLLPFLFSTASLEIQDHEYSTTDAMRRDTRFVVREIQGLHYRQTPISQIDFREFLNHYLSELDYNHLYFLQEDIDHYHMRFTPEVIRGKLLRGDLYPAFQIFKDYRNRALTRLDWIIDRLEGEFDFSKEEAYVIDRNEEPWPESEEEADKLWTRRLKYDLLNELLPSLSSSMEDAGIDGNENLPGPEFPPESLFERLRSEDFQEDLAEAKETIRHRYERWKKSLNELEPIYIQERYLTTLMNMYDPHSTFLSSDSLKEFSMAMENSFVGIGAMLEDDEGHCTIRELLPGGPAEQSRLLHPGDVIMGVAQGDGEMVDIVDMSLRKIVKLIKGEKGTEVRLKIQPADSPDPSVRKVISLIRDEVKLTANLASAEIFQIPHNDERTLSIGVIDLPSFYGGNGDQISRPTDDVEELLTKLKDMGVEGIILDLRRNGGGLLDEAVSLTGLFIPEGPVVQIRDYAGNINFRADEDPGVAWKGPLMVLISRYSASASEIVAGALQTYNRALVVGDSSTHGKGTVQAVVETNSRSLFPKFLSEPPSAAKITIQKFYLPNGESTQKAGVLSDITIPSINEHLPIGEADLDNPLSWDTIDPIKEDFALADSNFALVTPALIEELERHSARRQNSLPEFDYLERSIEYYRKLRNQEEISLNLEKRSEKKKSEKELQEAMSDELEKLAEHNYPSKSVILNVRKEQEALSQKIKSLSEREESSPLNADRDVKIEEGGSFPESPVDSSTEVKVVDKENSGGDEENEEGSEPSFDVHLRESLRIMRDWIALENQETLEEKPSAVTVRVDSKSKN